MKQVNILDGNLPEGGRASVAQAQNPELGMFQRRFGNIIAAATMLGASLPALAETVPNAPTLAQNTITAPEKVPDALNHPQFKRVDMPGAAMDIKNLPEQDAMDVFVFPEKGLPTDDRNLIFAFIGAGENKNILKFYNSKTKQWIDWDGETMSSTIPFVNYNFKTTVPLLDIKGLQGSTYAAQGKGVDGKTIMADVYEHVSYAKVNVQTQNQQNLPVIKEAQLEEEKISAPIPITSPANVSDMLGGTYRITTTVDGKPVIGAWTNQPSSLKPGDTVQIALAASGYPSEAKIAQLITTNDKGETTAYTQEVVTTNGVKAPVTPQAPETVKTPEVTKVNATELSTDPDAPTVFYGALQIVMPAGTTVGDIIRVYYNGESSNFLPFSGKPILADTLGQEYGFSYTNDGGNVDTFFTLLPQKTPDKQP